MCVRLRCRACSRAAVRMCARVGVRACSGITYAWVWLRARARANCACACVMRVRVCACMCARGCVRVHVRACMCARAAYMVHPLCLALRRYETTCANGSRKWIAARPSRRRPTSCSSSQRAESTARSRSRAGVYHGYYGIRCSACSGILEPQWNGVKWKPGSADSSVSRAARIVRR